MSAQIENENDHLESSFLENQDPSLASKNTSLETGPNPDLKSEPKTKKSFLEKWETSRFLLVRGSFLVLRSVWIVVITIAGFIAWLISLLFI